jgi:RNA polymerase sigma-70 factor (family 1)
VSISTTYNEAELLERVAKGDEDAFSILFQQYFRPLCFFAQSFVDDVDAAKDIAQEALYKLWNRRENFLTLENIKAFLYISVKNACLNYLKAEQRRTVRHQEVVRQAEQQEDFLEMLAIKEELLQKILLEIDSLPDKYGSIIRLAFVEGLSHQQIAERLSIPAATVRKQKERGVKLLQSIVLKKKLAALLPLALSLFS